jgi:hypothetical protein
MSRPEDRMKLVAVPRVFFKRQETRLHGFNDLAGFRKKKLKEFSVHPEAPETARLGPCWGQ